MNKTSLFRVWIQAARLRTLPLSVAGILTGNALALDRAGFSWIVFSGTLLTAVCFQILSNFANDYGDGIKGTDNDDRIGPKRVLQQNLLSPSALFRGIVLTAIIGLLLSAVTIGTAFGIDQLIPSAIFLLLALAAIWAAYRYTAGNRAYGYRALGDLFVLLFFGLLAVLGSYFLQTKTLSLTSLWFALAVGGLSVGVLNLNNMRDMENDTAVGKKTIAAILGLVKAKRYHAFVLFLSMLALALGLAETAKNNVQLLPIIIVLPVTIQLRKTLNTTSFALFDAQLKPLALATFVLSILLFITQLIQ